EEHDQRHGVEDRLAERGEADDLTACNADRIAAGHLIGEPRDEAGESNAQGHRVVDTDHVSAQTRIDGDRAVGAVATGRRYVTVEMRHGLSSLSYPANAGFRRESSTGKGRALGTCPAPRG